VKFVGCKLKLLYFKSWLLGEGDEMFISRVFCMHVKVSFYYCLLLQFKSSLLTNSIAADLFFS